MRGFLLGVCLLVFVTYVQGIVGNTCLKEHYYNPSGAIRCTFYRVAKENDRCLITCDYGYKLKGVQEIVCRNGKWSGSLGECEAITCPPLKPVALASVSPRSCLTRPSVVSDMCLITCPEGYHGKGHWGREERRFCKENGEWYGNDTVCEDGQPPHIACPNHSIIVPTDPGQATGKVKLPKPAYSDNSQKVDPNAKLVFKSSVPLESDMKIGRYSGRFTVEDGAGLVAACNFLITVEDREPPKIFNCPSDITRVVDSDSVRVTWDEPKATDNSGEAEMYSNIPNASTFYLGTTTVSYTARDKAWNTNEKCSFRVTVKQTCKDVNIPPASLPPNVLQCSAVAADLSKCDARVPYFPSDIRYKDICKKTCKVCQ